MCSTNLMMRIFYIMQAHVSGYDDTDLDISDTATDKILSQKERQELLDKQINDQVRTV